MFFCFFSYLLRITLSCQSLISDDELFVEKFYHHLFLLEFLLTFLSNIQSVAISDSFNGNLQSNVRELVWAIYYLILYTSSTYCYKCCHLIMLTFFTYEVIKMQTDSPYNYHLQLHIQRSSIQNFSKMTFWPMLVKKCHHNRSYDPPWSSTLADVPTCQVNKWGSRTSIAIVFYIVDLCTVTSVTSIKCIKQLSYYI